MSTSKYDKLSLKYPIINATTGFEIYDDPSFKSKYTYFDFDEDYNKLIHREIKNNNIIGVYNLCYAIYACTHTHAPRFDPMLEIALKDQLIGPDMVAFVLYMWKFCREIRNNSITLNDALKFSSSQDKVAIVLEFFIEEEENLKLKFQTYFKSMLIDLDLLKQNLK